jgi:thioredoxin-like negative regulator of GroEL
MESASALLQVKNDATSKPRDLYQLLTWMNRNGLALMVSEWVPGLPQDLAAQPPVCVAVAEAYSIGTEWEKLQQTVTGASWESHEYLRTAFLALALKKLGDDEASATAWNASLAEGRESPEATESLARIALNWGWEERAEAVLWSLSQSARCPRWVIDTLWSTSLRRGESNALYDLSKLLANAAPKDLAHRHNVVLLGLLTRGKESAIHTMAESLYEENPGNADIAATYGLSLYQRGRLDDALAVMDKLSPAQLRKPGVARYFGIFLSAAKHPKAQEYFDIGMKGPLLPEEKALMVARNW